MRRERILRSLPPGHAGESKTEVFLHVEDSGGKAAGSLKAGRIHLRLAVLFAAAALVAALGGGCSKDKAALHFEKAEEYFAEGAHRLAIDEYSRVVNTFHASPYAARSQYRIAFIYNRILNEPQRAIDAYAALFHLFPSSDDAITARQELARLYSRMGEHRKAVEEYQRLLAKRPEEGEKYRYAIAMEYLRMNDLRQARIEFKEIMEAYPSSPNAPKVRFQIANTHYIEGELYEALDLFDDIIRDYPGGEAAMEARFGKAKVLSEMGRLSEALDLLRALEPDYTGKEAVRARIESLEKRLSEGPGREDPRRRR